MKVLQLGKAFPPIKGIGGVEKVIEMFYFGLNNCGIECDVLGMNDNLKPVIDVFCKSGKIYRESLLIRLKSTLISFGLVIRLFKIAKSYDIIHVHHPDPMSFISLFIVRPKAKIVIHWHSDIVRQKFAYLFFRFLEKWILARADLILCTSPTYYSDNKILKPFLNKVSHLPIGYRRDSEALNRNLLNSGKKNVSSYKTIIYIGRLVYYKGVEYLIKAMSLIKSDTKLYIIGEGNLKFSLISLVKSLNISDRIIFLGSLSEKEKIYYMMTSELLVLPSIYKSEAYGIVQVEAMAYGLPVVSTQIIGSGVDWVNQNGQTGITIPIRDEISLANAIDRICMDPHLKKKLSEGALKRYNEHFTDDSMLKGLIIFYENLLSGPLN